MVTLHGTIEYGPLLVRADEAARMAYLMDLAVDPELRHCGRGTIEVGQTLVGYADGDLTFEEAVEDLGGSIPKPKFDLVEHLGRQRAFSEKTFGPGARTKGVVDHIRKELAEIEADPADIEEWVDVIILAFDGAWRAGWEPQAIVDALVAKQTKHEGRQWPDWRTADPEKAIEHVRLPAGEGSRFIGMTLGEIAEQRAIEDQADRGLDPMLVTLISEQMGVQISEVVASASFKDDLGADSLDLLEIISRAEDQFRISITDVEADAMRTVGDLAQAVALHRALG